MAVWESIMIPVREITRVPVCDTYNKGPGERHDIDPGANDNNGPCVGRYNDFCVRNDNAPCVGNIKDSHI